jgi:small conductance mechanosensitive channel
VAQPALPVHLTLPAISTEPSVPPIIDRAHRLLGGDDVLLRNMADAAGGLAVNLALAAAIFAATIWASRWLSRMAEAAIARAHRQRPADPTLQSFAGSLVRYFVVVVGLIAVLQQVGVKATSVIAVLGAASLAIGLALQGALANVAAGVMLLILRPYRVGDRVDISGKSGTVKGLDLFSTRLSDLDNLNVFVPNGKAFGEIIVNHTSTPHRRIELEFAVGFADDVDRALALMLEAARAERRVLVAPAPWARMTAMVDQGVKLTLRVWVAPGDDIDTRADLMKAVKDRFDAERFSLALPRAAVAEPAAPIKH